VVELSSFYYDMLKDRLYTKAAKNKSRRSAQTAALEITSALVRMAAPVLTFTAEEIWKYLPKGGGDAASVHMALFPEEAEMRTGLSAEKIANWEMLARVRAEVLKALEGARAEKIINSGLEAKVLLNGDLALKAKLKPYLASLPALFIVSQVEIPAVGAEGSGAAVEVTIQKADGQKCERCWNYSTHVGENARYPTVCERCTEALNEIETELARTVTASPAGNV
jgi:isoleucyl-tRNA synthetase